MRLKTMRRIFILLIASFLFLWFIVKSIFFATDQERPVREKQVRLDGLYSSLHEVFSIDTANKSVLNVSVPVKTLEEHLFLVGVLSKQNQGRWGNDFVCTDSGIKVKAVQSVDYVLLGKTEALFIPSYALQNTRWDALQKSRSPNQLWVFNSFESPVHTTRLTNKWARYGFNWTFTYRSDSTFPSPYGRYIPGSPLLADNDTTNWAEGKTKFAAWIGSNCGNTQWPRLQFVKQLQKLIPLDTFGSCGAYSCPKNPKCGQILKQYKFYFALENSNCKDYITEKFWSAPIKNSLIPVVYGTSREDYERVAPPKSFIHVDDFRTMSDLADYLNILDKNDSLFNEYFEWKKKGSVVPDLIGDYYMSRNVMCPIATMLKLRRDAGRTDPETLDMNKWWTDSCRTKRPAMMTHN